MSKSNEVFPIYKIDQTGIIAESKQTVNTMISLMTKKEYDFILYLASLVKPNDKEFNTYEIPIKELLLFFDKNNPRKESTKKRVRDAINTIFEKKIKLYDKKNYKEHWFCIVEYCEYDHKKDTVKIRLSKFMEQFYIDIKEKHYTVYMLEEVLELRSITAARLYQWAYSKKDIKNEVPIFVDQAKMIFNNSPQITTKAFIQKLDAAIKEINCSTHLNISYKKIYCDPNKKNKMSSLSFSIQSNYNANKESVEKKENVSDDEPIFYMDDSEYIEIVEKLEDVVKNIEAHKYKVKFEREPLYDGGEVYIEIPNYEQYIDKIINVLDTTDLKYRCNETRNKRYAFYITPILR